MVYFIQCMPFTYSIKYNPERKYYHKYSNNVSHWVNANGGFKFSPGYGHYGVGRATGGAGDTSNMLQWTKSQRPLNIPGFLQAQKQVYVPGNTNYGEEKIKFTKS